MPQYDLVCHPTAKRELDSLPPEMQTQVRERLADVAATEQPTSHEKVKHLKGTTGLFRVRIGDVRAVCELSKPELQVLRIGKRNGVYDVIDDIREERLSG